MMKRMCRLQTRLRVTVDRLTPAVGIRSNTGREVGLETRLKDWVEMNRKVSGIGRRKWRARLQFMPKPINGAGRAATQRRITQRRSFSAVWPPINARNDFVCFSLVFFWFCFCFWNHFLALYFSSWELRKNTHITHITHITHTHERRFAALAVALWTVRNDRRRRLNEERWADGEQEWRRVWQGTMMWLGPRIGTHRGEVCPSPLWKRPLLLMAGPQRNLWKQCSYWSLFYLIHDLLITTPAAAAAAAAAAAKTTKDIESARHEILLIGSLC